MTARIIQVDPFDLVVFGATGDLARRKLLPALFQRDLAGQLPDAARIVGAARSTLSRDAYRAQAAEAIARDAAEHPEAAARFLARIDYLALDGVSDGGWSELATRLAEAPDRIRVFYFSTSPELFGPLCERIQAHGLASAQSRVVLEKPIGKNLASSRAVNDAVGRVFPEACVYRIDHYLGKETVQNLMALRFANALFEPLWRAAHIDHVQITVAESLGVEGRAGYYDTAGAMRDMVQNHLLQLLCLVAMEPPGQLTADAVRDEKLKVLQALRPVERSEHRADRRARPVPRRCRERRGRAGLRDELGASSGTETFVAVKAGIENWRWAGVPFYLRTGKRLPERLSEIVIAFRPIPHSAFSERAGTIHSNHLVIRLQPDEGVRLWLMIKDPGPGGMRLKQVPLDMSFAEAFGVRNPDAYERLLMDIVRGNQTLFMRRDEVEAAWSWVDPVMALWRDSEDTPKPYAAGTWGPSAAIALIERDGRTWHEDANWNRDARLAT
jgi:glucose-6-phosphate 1-dehydrogenase